MQIRKIIVSKIISQLSLQENVQLADKAYFKSGKLDENDKEFILSVTSGDNYTKLISDFYFYLKNDTNVYPAHSIDKIKKEIQSLYGLVVEYNKNIFPISEFDIYNAKQISDLISALNSRKKIIEELKKLPSIATRNLKQDVRKERNWRELKDYFEKLEYFMAHYALLGNRDEKTKIKVLQKMFKANATLDDLMLFVDEKQNFIGGVEISKEDIKRLSLTEDFEIIYEQGPIMIVRVDSPEGIKAIGCNSLWCFTYGSGFEEAYKQWNNYSYNDIVYVLIDFREKSDSEDFMHVLISTLMDEDGDLRQFDEPDEETSPLFNMSNENYFGPYSTLKHLFGDNYQEIVKKYLNFDEDFS